MVVVCTDRYKGPVTKRTGETHCNGLEGHYHGDVFCATRMHDHTALLRCTACGRAYVRGETTAPWLGGPAAEGMRCKASLPWTSAEGFVYQTGGGACDGHLVPDEATAPLQGTGTRTDPYQITPKQWAAIGRDYRTTIDGAKACFEGCLKPGGGTRLAFVEVA